MGFSQSKAARAPVKKTSIACLAGKKKITPSGWCLATRTFFAPTPGAGEVVAYKENQWKNPGIQMISLISELFFFGSINFAIKKNW